MAEAMEVQIAAAVARELNDPARGWSPAFQAEQTWKPWYEPKDLKNLKVAVVAIAIDAEDEHTRGDEEFDYLVGVDFQQLVKPADTATINALCKLVQDVHDWFREDHELATLAGWQVVKAVREEIIDGEKLMAQGVFETYIAVTVRGQR